MNIQEHDYKFSHYETEWIDGAPCEPYPEYRAVLVCKRCGQITKSMIMVDEQNCINREWPRLPYT
jgi:hypothetical protein